MKRATVSERQPWKHLKSPRARVYACLIASILIMQTSTWIISRNVDSGSKPDAPGVGSHRTIASKPCDQKDRPCRLEDLPESALVDKSTMSSRGPPSDQRGGQPNDLPAKLSSGPPSGQNIRTHSARESVPLSSDHLSVIRGKDMRNTNMHNQEGYAPVTADHGVKVLEPKEATVDSQQGVVKDSQQAVDNPKSEVQVKKGADEEPVAAAKIKSEEKYTKTTEEAAGVKTEAGAKAKAAEEATKTAFNDPTLVSMAQPLGQGSGAENPLDETRATVIVLWRESMSLTIPSLREVLSDPVVPVNVIYIHLDYFLSRGVLEEARQLQRQYTNLEVVVQSDWKNRHEMLREVLPSVKTR